MNGLFIIKPFNDNVSYRLCFYHSKHHRSDCTPWSCDWTRSPVTYEHGSLKLSKRSTFLLLEFFFFDIRLVVLWKRTYLKMLCSARPSRLFKAGLCGLGVCLVLQVIGLSTTTGWMSTGTCLLLIIKRSINNFRFKVKIETNVN